MKFNPLPFTTSRHTYIPVMPVTAVGGQRNEEEVVGRAQSEGESQGSPLT